MAPAVLFIVVLWALVAVLLLTGTLLAAREINENVKIIKPEVGSIHRNTQNIRLAKRTGRISKRIAQAATPLTGKLSQTLAAARSINARAQSIFVTANAINRTAAAINSNVRSINAIVHAILGNANAINGTVRAINGTVTAINGNANAINANARSINANVLSIGVRAGAILSTAGEINGSARVIRTRLGTIIATVGNDDRGAGSRGGGRTINSRVAGINLRAERARQSAVGIASDLAKILAGVGTTNSGATVLGHANSIDCSSLLNTVIFGPTQACNK